MKRYEVSNEFAIPCTALGCRRVANMEVNELEKLIITALEGGVNYFDHADFYGQHQAEVRFGEVLRKNPSLREQMLVQSKCGIRAGEGVYDSSYEHILQSVDNSLRKLHVDYLDALLIHRPDVLAEPDEIARAFQRLEETGKVRYFGVSNHNPMQMEVLQQATRQKLLFNQMQMSIVRTGMIDQGVNVNTLVPGAADRDGGVLEYCKLRGIVLQVWSPFQYDNVEGVFLDNPHFPEINQKLEEMSRLYGLSKTGLAVAWLVRLPLRMQVLAGTTNCDRLREIIAGANTVLSREDWYAIYRAAGNQLP